MAFDSSGGKCVIFSAPSGAGKTTIVQYLLGKLPELAFSISACSRDPRGEEEHGKHYYFLGIEGFKQKIDLGEFIEWEEVYTNNFYGTLASELERIWGAGKTVIFDVDVVGGLNLKKIMGDNALAIFVQPPSFEALEDRLRFRSTETEEKITMRLAKAQIELARAPEFDYILLNDDLQRACKEAEAVVRTFIS
ncbi:guanylate kinase [Fluviicola chungangensis]|uniref:Guanylate kinase n=1 Tax=Fluviicola chungangensis TaxID=2597671 RepID=A0A556MJ89_9FLAO|nr:guanylate kinase [Fluviicola chungangensis]TSJ39984.1 guanylate kinase [Fluviicola chungangensis]